MTDLGHDRVLLAFLERSHEAAVLAADRANAEAVELMAKVEADCAHARFEAEYLLSPILDLQKTCERTAEETTQAGSGSFHVLIGIVPRAPVTGRASRESSGA